MKNQKDLNRSIVAGILALGATMASTSANSANTLPLLLQPDL